MNAIGKDDGNVEMGRAVEDKRRKAEDEGSKQSVNHECGCAEVVH